MPIEISSNIVPRNGNTWPVVEDTYIKGGVRPLATLGDFQSVDPLALKPGMMFYVQDTQTLYVLGSNLSLVKHTEKPFTVAVIGDSISSEYPILEESWPGILEAKLKHQGVPRAKVVNAAIGGSTYAASADSLGTFKFGTLTQVEYACSTVPDVVMFVYGFNDTVAVVDESGVIDYAALDVVIQKAIDAIEYIRAHAPQAKVFLIEEHVWDNDHPTVVSGTGPALKQRSVLPFMWTRIDNTVSVEDLEKPIRPRASGVITAMLHLYAQLYLQLNGEFYVGAMPYFKIARLGGLSPDLLHPSRAGMTLQAASMLDVLIGAQVPSTLQQLLPTINRRDYTAQFNTFFDSVFGSPGGQPDAEGIRVEQYKNQFNYVDHSSAFSLVPNLWWSPIRPSVSVSRDVRRGRPLVLTIDGGVPESSISLSFNGSPWSAFGNLSPTGSMYESLAPSDNFWMGTHSLRIKFGSPLDIAPEFVLGPFEFEVATLVSNRIVVIGDSTVPDNFAGEFEATLRRYQADVEVRCLKDPGATLTSIQLPNGAAKSLIMRARDFGPNLVILSLGLNDCLGAVTEAGSFNETALETALTNAVTALNQAIPTSEIAIAIPRIHELGLNVATSNQGDYCLVEHWDTTLPLDASSPAQPASSRLKGIAQALLSMTTHAQTLRPAYFVDLYWATRMGYTGTLSKNLIDPKGSYVLALMHASALKNASADATKFVPGSIFADCNPTSPLRSWFVNSDPNQGPSSQYAAQGELNVESWWDTNQFRVEFDRTVKSDRSSSTFVVRASSPLTSLEVKLGSGPFEIISIDPYKHSAQFDVGPLSVGSNTVTVRAETIAGAHATFLTFNVTKTS